MVKATVKVRNTTGFDFRIREGNKASLSVVKRGRSCKLVVNVNESERESAPHREFVLVRMIDNTALEPAFSSDDVVKFKEILIKIEGGLCFWEGTASAPEAAVVEPSGAPTSCAVAASIFRSVICIGYVIYSMCSDFA